VESESAFDVRAASGGAAFLIGWLARSVVVLLLLVILSRLLGPSDFGLYTIVISIFYVIEMVGYMGVDATVRKKLPEIRSGRQKLVIINSAFLVSGLVAIAIALIMLFLSDCIAILVYRNAFLSAPIGVAAIAVILSTVFNVAVASLLGLGKSKEAAKANVAFSLAFLVSAPLLVYAGFGVLGAVAGLAVGNAVAALLSLAYLEFSLPTFAPFPKRSDLKKMVAFSLPVFVSNVAATFATSFGALALGVYAVSSVVGNYGVAFKLGSFIIIILNAVNAALLPSFSYALARRSLSKRISAMYSGSLYYTLIFLAPALAYLVAVAVPLMGLLFSSQYSAAPAYFVIIAVGMAVGMIGSYAGSLVIGYGDPKRFMIYQLSFVAFEVVLTLLLVPSFGIAGLLVAMYVVSPLLLDLVYLMAMKKEFSTTPDFSRLPKLVAASVVVFVPMALISYALGHGIYSIPIDAAVLLLVYPPALAFLGAVDSKNLAFIGSVAKSTPLVRPLMRIAIAYTKLFVVKR
jgi:stage V sporulation protein B